MCDILRNAEEKEAIFSSIPATPSRNVLEQSHQSFAYFRELLFLFLYRRVLQ